MAGYSQNEAHADFSKAKGKARLQGLINSFQWKSNDLLSWYEVTSIIKPKSETYLGMCTIPVDRIIGSEGRYRDFSSAFMPKRERLRERWVRIDTSLMDGVVLPPISVYSLGGWYFVRDGNHRVSVAKATGGEFIDAEVVQLDSKIPLETGITMREIRRRVVMYEREMFLEQYGSLPLPFGEIVFTSPGAYPELLNHILVHKYYMNEGRKDELSLSDAASHWFDNIYKPIVDVIREDHLLSSFPGATEGDMYLWIVKRWDELKQTEDPNLPIQDAVKTVERETGGAERIKRYLNYFFDHFKKH